MKCLFFSLIFVGFLSNAQTFSARVGDSSSGRYVFDFESDGKGGLIVSVSPVNQSWFDISEVKGYMVSDNQRLNLGIEKIESGKAWFKSLPKSYAEKLSLDSTVKFLIKQGGTEITGTFTDSNLSNINNIIKNEPVKAGGKQYFLYSEESTIQHLLANTELTRDVLSGCKITIKVYGDSDRAKALKCIKESYEIKKQLGDFSGGFLEDEDKVKSATSSQMNELSRHADSISKDFEYIQSWVNSNL